MTKVWSKRTSSLAGNSEEWDTLQSDRPTDMSTLLDSTVGWNDSNLQKSCIAQRTRSQTELREKASKTIESNISELGSRFEKMKEERNKSRLEDSWEFVTNRAKDSMCLHPDEAVKDLEDIYKKIVDIDRTVHSLSLMEENFKTKKGVTWSDTDTTIGGDIQPAERTFVIEDPRYGNKQGVVTKALDSLLNMKLSLADIEQMENLVKIILALCLEFSIKSQGIQEDMVEMGNYIKELKSTKEETGKNSAEIERQEKEIKGLTE